MCKGDEDDMLTAEERLAEANKKFDSIKHLVWADAKKNTTKNKNGDTVITKDDIEWREGYGKKK